MSIKVTSVSKKYGNQIALNSISFSAKKGEVIGFLGPNGAGKSSMMKILTGYINADSGEVLVNEIDVLTNAIEAQKHIGYLPEQNPLYNELYVKEYLQFQASIRKINNVEVDKAIEKVGLSFEAHKIINQLSKGYQQRVGLAAAILHNPDVLILDEPTTGLDPNQLVEIRQLIKELGKHKTVLFSTHIMQEVEAVCNRVIIIKKGEILLDKQLKEIQDDSKQIIEVIFDHQIKEKFLTELPNVISVKNYGENYWAITFDAKEDMRSKIFDVAQLNGLKILELNAKRKTLEKSFIELTTD